MKKIISLIVTALLLSACAGTPVLLNRTTFETNKVETILISNKKTNIVMEQNVSGGTSGAAAGGLLGALIGSAIDSGINSKRAKNLAPILNSLGYYNPNQFLATSLEKEAHGLAFEGVPNIQIGGSNKNKLVPVLVPSYTINLNYSGIRVDLNVSVKQFGEGEKDFHSSYYALRRNSILTNLDQSRQNWIDNPQDLQRKVESGIVEVVRRFVADFNGEDYTIDDQIGMRYPSLVENDQALLESRLDDSNSSIVVESQDMQVVTDHPDLVKALRSKDELEMRFAAKSAGANKLYNDPGIITASIDVLKEHIDQGIDKKDKYLIDGLSWCLLNLGNARDAKAKPILEEIIGSTLPKKLRSHAIHAMKLINGVI